MPPDAPAPAPAPAPDGPAAPLVRVATEAGVATVTLDSPAKRNALSRALLAQLRDALSALTADPAVRVVVLTGAGSVFCSGADLGEQRDGGGPGPVGLPEVLRLLMESPTPVVARVNGPARAGGVGLLAACDLAVAPSSATFGFSEVRLGVAPAVIAVPVLRRLPARAARELFLTGAVLDGARAAEVGLVDRAVQADDLDAAVSSYVDALVAAAPGALAATKGLLASVPGKPLREAFAAMERLSAERFASDEGQEGIAAFLAKRPPSWVPEGRG